MEVFTDQIGVVYQRTYLAARFFNATSQLAADAIQLAADIQAAEIAGNVADVLANGSLATPHLNYSTAAQNFAALRTAYAIAGNGAAVMIGDFLNTLTSAQLQAAFGLTAGQVTTLRTNKLQPAATLAASWRASTGQ